MSEDPQISHFSGAVDGRDAPIGPGDTRDDGAAETHPVPLSSPGAEPGGSNAQAATDSPRKKRQKRFTSDGAARTGDAISLFWWLHPDDDATKFAVMPAVVRASDRPVGDELHGYRLHEFHVDPGGDRTATADALAIVSGTLNGTGPEVDADLALAMSWPVTEEAGHVHSLKAIKAAVQGLVPLAFATPAPGDDKADVQRWGEAIVYRGMPSVEFLEKPLSVAWSDSVGSDDWRVLNGNRAFVIEEMNLLKHRESKQKDGDAITQGPLFIPPGKTSSARQKAAMLQAHLLILDLDDGRSFDDIQAAVLAKPYAAIIATTHSHGKGETTVLKDEIVKFVEKLRGTVEFTAEDVVAYLAAAKAYLPSAFEGAVLSDERRGHKGMEVVLTHKPFDKTRVTFFLKQPFDFDSFTPRSKGEEEWKRVYYGFAKGVMGVDPDKKCLEPHQPLYTPSHKKGRPHRIVFANGEDLDLATVPRLDYRPQKTGQQSTSTNGSKARKDDDGLTGEQRAFLAKFASVLEIERLVGDHDSTMKDRPGGGFFCECPNDHNHTKPEDGDDDACHVQDSNPVTGGFDFHCWHAGCAKLYGDGVNTDRGRMLFAWAEMHEVGIPGLLEYCGEGAADEWASRNGGKGSEPRVEGFADMAAFDAALAAAGPDTEKLKAIIRRLAASSSLDAADQTIARDQVATAMGIGKRPYDKMFREAKEQIKAQKRQARAENRGEDEWLPDGYSVEDGWICVAGDAEDPKKGFVQVCQIFKPLALIRDGDSTRWQTNIEFADGDGVTKKFSINFGMMRTEPAKVLGPLTDAGFRSETGLKQDGALKRLFMTLMSCSDIPRSTLCSKPGWQSGNRYFVSPSGVAVGALPENEDVTLAPGAKFAGKAKRGTLAEQVAHLSDIAHGCTPSAIGAGPHTGSADRGMFHLLIGIGAGLVGCAATLLDSEECGGPLIVGDSGLGKTTSLELGASLWGSPIAGEGPLTEAKGTMNGFEVIAELGTGTFFALNELQHIEDQQRKLPPLLFGLSGGQGSNRMKADSSGNKLAKTWRLFGAVSSEKSLRDLIGATAADGLFARFPEITLGDGARLNPDHPFRAALTRHRDDVFGHVGEAFVGKLIEHGYNAPEGIERLSGEVEAFWVGLSKKLPNASRALRKLAWIRWTLEKMVEWEFLPNDAAVEWAVEEAAQNVVDGSAGDVFSGGRVLDTFYANVNAFITSKRIVILESKDDDPESDKFSTDPVGWMWTDKSMGGRVLIVQKSKLPELVPSGKSSSGAASELYRAGVLEPRRKMGRVDLVRVKHTMKGRPEFQHYRFVLKSSTMTGESEPDEE